MTIERIPSAVLSVDLVNAFKGEGGELPVPGTEEVISPFEEVTGRARTWDIPRLFIREWHRKRSVHFKGFGGPWPEHGVQNTWGSQFIEGHTVRPDLKDELIISKGMVGHGYSGFEGFHLPTSRTLDEVLQEMGTKRLFVGGVATEYCVKNTVLDGLALGYEVVVMPDLIRPIDRVAGEESLQEMAEKGALILPSQEARKLWVPQ
jgi:nicotinamidase/pyrazinamidase